MLAALVALLVGTSSAPGLCIEVDQVRSQQTCCRICSTGKACGNSCINRQLTCHKPPGCACDG